MEIENTAYALVAFLFDKRNGCYDGRVVPYLPMYPNFGEDYMHRKSTKFTCWITKNRDFIFDLGHLKKGWLIVVDGKTRNVRCGSVQELGIKEPLNRICDYCVEGFSSPKPSVFKTGKGMMLIEYHDEKGRLHRKDGRPARISKKGNSSFIETYRHGKLHSYGPDNPASEEYDDKTYRALFYNKGKLLGTVTFGESGTRIYALHVPESTIAVVSKSNYSETTIRNSDGEAIVIVQNNVIKREEPEGFAVIERLINERFNDFFYTRYYEYHHGVMPGYFYQSRSSIFQTPREYFVHPNQPVDKPVLNDGKIVGWETTTWGKEFGEITELYFQDRKVCQSISQNARNHVFISSEARYHMLLEDFSNWTVIWWISSFMPCSDWIKERYLGIKWIENTPKVKNVKVQIKNHPLEGWEGEKFPDSTHDFRELKNSELPKTPSKIIELPERSRLLSEIYYISGMIFPEYIGETLATVVYSSSITSHIPLLVDMFPHAVFVIFDPKFEVKVKPKKRLLIFNSELTSEILDRFSEKVYLISDVFAENSKHKNVAGSLIHFRFPQGVEKCRVPMEIMRELILTQPWTHEDNPEFALYSSFTREFDYSAEEYRKMVSLYSNIRKTKYTRLQNVFGESYDLLREATIIRSYLKVMDPRSCSNPVTIISWMRVFDKYFKDQTSIVKTFIEN